MNADPLPLTPEEEAHYRERHAKYQPTEVVRRIWATLDRSRSHTRKLADRLELALEAMAAAGHIVTKDGYCARCEGGCVVGFTNPSPEIRLVEPSPFGAKP